jgi:cation transport regulator ChaC
MSDPAVFAYGSLVSAASAAETLGRDSADPRPAVLGGWIRSFSLIRDNLRCEKTFAGPDGAVPDLVLALNVEPDPVGLAAVNGALIEVSPAELERLDRRELRYDRIDVTAAIALDAEGRAPEAVFTYVAKPANHAPDPPAGAVVLAAYERAVEAAFAELGEGQLEAFRRSTRPCPADRIEAELVSGEIPAGNPRAW